MGINKYNPEGYHDPTVYEALTHIEAERREERRQALLSRQRTYRPLVYICSPYSDDILNNERKARVFK